MSTSDLFFFIQGRVEVGELNADFSISGALFIVGRGFADFISKFNVQGRFEVGSPNADFMYFLEMEVALANSKQWKLRIIKALHGSSR